MTSILMRRIVAMVLTGLSLSVTGCGYKGPLYLPPPPPAAKPSTEAKPQTPKPAHGIDPATPGMPDTSNPASPAFEQDPSLMPAPIVISN